MILTVTLNPAIDKVGKVLKLNKGKTNRIEIVSSKAGGKGINVARAIRSLGGEVATTGLKGGFNGQFIEQGLAKEGITSLLLGVKGENRICFIIIHDEGEITEIYEEGPQIDSDEALKFMDYFHEISKPFSSISFSGSLPPGLPSDYVKELVFSLKDKQLYFDFTGQPLIEALSLKKTYLLKLNETEFLETFKIKKGDKLLKSIKTVSDDYDIPNICLTKSKEGSLLFHSNHFYKIFSTYEIPVVNPVGAGDAFLGSLMHFISQKEELIEACKKSVAASMSNVTLFEGGSINPIYYSNISKNIDIEEVKIP